MDPPNPKVSDMKVYYEADADLGIIQSKKVAVIGYGSQGHAHALNLRESGVKDLVVGLQPNSASKPKAEQEGLKVVTPTEAAKWADVMMILTPDEKQAVMYANEIEPHTRKGQHLMFGHGFNIHYNLIRPRADMDVSLSAPKGPGHTLRNQYQQGRGLPGLIAIHQDASGVAQAVALSYSKAIGNTRAGVIETEMHERWTSTLTAGALAEHERQHLLGFDIVLEALSPVADLMLQNFCRILHHFGHIGRRRLQIDVLTGSTQRRIGLFPP